MSATTLQILRTLSLLRSVEYVEGDPKVFCAMIPNMGGESSKTILGILNNNCKSTRCQNCLAARRSRTDVLADDILAVDVLVPAFH